MNSNRKAQAKDAILMETALRRLKKSPDFIVDVGVRAGTPPRNAQLIKRLLGGQMRAFNQFNDLQLLRGRISHSPTPPSPSMLFLSRRFSRVSSATHSFSSRASDFSPLTSVGLAGDIAGKPFLPSLQEVFGPFVIQALRYAFLLSLIHI